MVDASTTAGLLTSMLQPVSVSATAPIAATRRTERKSCMVGSSELEVEPRDPSPIGRHGEHVGVEELVYARGRGAKSEHVGIITLVVRLPQPEVTTANGD